MADALNIADIMKTISLLSQQQDQNDFTDRYNTPIPAEKKQAYQAWAKANGQDPVKGRYDYDLQGAFLGGAGQAGNGHFPDTYKKPNHTTFSDQSQYHGIDGYTGGTWVPQQGGKWSFRPTQTNLAFTSAPDLQQYMKTVEQGKVNVAPARQLPAPTGQGGGYTIADLMKYGAQ